jgi:hypothetical protein
VPEAAQFRYCAFFVCTRKEARDRARKAGNLDGGRILILIAAQNARRRWGPRRRGSTGNAIRPKGYLVSRQGPRPGIQARRLGFWQSTKAVGASWKEQRAVFCVHAREPVKHRARAATEKAMDNAGESVAGCNRSAQGTNARSFNRTVTMSTCSLNCQFDGATALGFCASSICRR